MNCLFDFLCGAAIVAVLAGCGGGGGGEAGSDDAYKYPKLLSASTSGVAPTLLASGSYAISSEKEFNVDCWGYCDISVEGLVNATRSGLNQGVTGYTGYYVAFKITDINQPASAVIKATSTTDPKYTKTFKIDVLPSVAEVLPVKLNGVVMTANTNGEYTITAGTQITIEDSRNLLGSNLTTTVSATNQATSANISVYVMSSEKYDIRLISGPSGGLTTITFSSFNPDVVIKLRWQ
jgi:hypothetical protein